MSLESFNSIFEKDLLEEMKTHGKFMSLKQGDIILDVDETIRLIPVILSGTIKVSRVDEHGNEILLYYVSPHESCAMTFTCCMQQVGSEIRAVAEDDVELLAIPIERMEQWMRVYPTWNSFVMNTIRARFNELLKTIDQIAFQKLDERLIHYLKGKAAATKTTLINLSHSKIAIDLASSREVISRLLKRLEQDKKVILYRNQIKLLREL